MATKTISIITPVWNQGHHTARFLLYSWKTMRDRPDVEFIVINNGSSDNTASLLKDFQAKAGGLKLITNEHNRGFSIACNQGAGKAGGDTLLFLNNDIMVWGDYVGAVLRMMDNDLIAGPELNEYDTGWNKFNGRPIPYVAGWCLAITKTTFEQLGGFDERYSPCDYEDLDLCYAAVQAGKGLLRLELPIRHISGGSAMPDRLAITERNRLKFAEKWGLL